MKKLLSLFTIMMLFGLTTPILTGCGGGRPSTDPADEMPANEDLTEDPTADTINP